MIFYNYIHLNNSVSFDCENLDRIESEAHLKKTKINFNGFFDLINFNLASVGKFCFKEYLIKEEPTFVKVDAVINNEYKDLFIDLVEHKDLLFQIKELDQRQRAQKINDYFLSSLGIDSKLVENMKIFMHLGIDQSIDQQIIMSNKAEDIARFSDVFDRTFLGETIDQKINFYEQKINTFKNDLNHLDLLNKIFINGLSVKIFKNEVLITEIKDSLYFYQFEIANQAKECLKDSIVKACLNNYKSLVRFFLLFSFENIEMTIEFAVFHDNESLLNDLLSDYPQFLSLAIKAASKKGDEYIVKKLLAKSPEQLGLAVNIAASFGHEILIRNILPDIKSISSQDLIKSIISAVKEGKISIVNFFLSKEPQHLGLAVVNAALYNQEAMIISLLPEGVICPPVQLRDSIVFASKKGNIGIVKYLLSKEPQHLGLAVVNAALYNQEAMIISLLPEGVTCPHVQLKDSIIFAAQEGNIGIVNYLLLKDPSYLGIAVVSAAEFGKEDLIKDVLSDGKIISNEYLVDAIIQSIFEGNEKLVKILLLKSKNLSSEELKHIIVLAAQEGHISIVNNLLLKAPQHLGIAVINAASYGYFLFEYAISSEDLKNAVIAAAEKGHKSVVEKFLLKFPQNLGVSIIYTAFTGNESDESLVKLLLPENSVSSDYLKEAVIVASRFGYEAIVKKLLLKKPKYASIAIVSAAKYGHEKLIDYFLSEYSEISLDILKRAAFLAYENNHQNIACLIFLKIAPIKIPSSIKKCVLELKKDSIEKNGSWESLIWKLETYAWSSLNRNKILKILRKAAEKLIEEAPFAGTPKKSDSELLKSWYIHIKDMMATIDCKIDPDPTKDVAEKETIIYQCFDFCGGAWQSQFDQIQQKLISFQESVPLEVLIGKIINDVVSRIAELINKNYAESIYQYPDVHDQNKIRFYLKDFLLDLVLDDHLSDLDMDKSDVIFDFLEYFNIEIVVEEIISSIKTNEVFEQKIFDYCQNELFKDCQSNDEIDFKIEQDRLLLQEKLEKLDEIKPILNIFDSIINDLKLDDMVKILNLLGISSNKELFEFEIKKHLKKPNGDCLITSNQVSSLFGYKMEFNKIFLLLNEIRSLNNCTHKNIISQTKEQLMKSFIDIKQDKIEAYSIEDFQNKHFNPETSKLLPSGINIILKKMGFLRF